MNVLYLTYDGLTDGLGRSQVLPYIFGLCKKGHTFTIVSFEKKERFESGKSVIRKLIAPHNIEWVPLPYTSFPPVLSTVYDVLKLKYTVRKLHQKKDFDMVHCRSYITSLAGIYLKKKFGVKFIFDMRAFYADERVDGGLWNLKNPIYKQVFNYFKNKEKQFLQTANFTISLTEKGKNIIHSWSQIKGQPVPIEVIPCCADLQHFHPSQINSELQTTLKKRFKLNGNHFVITYLGSIGTWYLLDEMLDFFKILLRSKPHAKFLFTTADNPKQIRSRAEEKGIDSEKILIQSAQREEVPTYLSLADVAIFFIQPVFSKSGSSPTKHGEMLGMGLPVIANSNVGDIESIIEKTDSGLLIREFTESAYQQAIAQIDKLLETPVSALQNAAQKYYSLEKGVEKYDQVYRSV